MTQPRSPQKDRRICLGKIVAAHGVKGLVKIRPFGDDFTLLGGILYTAENGPQTISITLKNPLGKYILAQIEGVTDRTQAEEIRGTELYAERTALPDLDEDEGHYFEDLLGRKVFDEHGESVGNIIAVENYGASDLLEIRSPRGTFLIPFTDDHVTDVKDTEIVIKDYESFL